MKKIIIAACMALLGCGSVFAQQGKQAIGGNLSYGTEIESVGIGLNRAHRYGSLPFAVYH